LLIKDVEHFDALDHDNWPSFVRCHQKRAAVDALLAVDFRQNQ
jgi:hypothetical protein